MVTSGYDFAGRVALVTGSSSGIGEAIARALGALGCRVVVNSSSTPDVGTKVAESIGDAIYVQGDVAEEATSQRLVGAALDAFGRLDVLINNAGVTKAIPHADLDAVTDEVFRRILDVNLFGTWYLTRAALPHLRASGEGAVVNITSVAGLRARGSSIPYAVSKAAVNHLTLLLAKVAGPEVRVSAVAPGFIETPWTADFQEARDRACANPLRRAGQPEDVADAVIGLLRSRYSTGQILALEGGGLL